MRFRALFEEEVRPGVCARLAELIVRIVAVHDERRLGCRCLADPTYDVDAAAPRHPDVDNRDVGLGGEDSVLGSRNIISLTDNANSLELGDQVGQTFSYYRGIVGDKDVQCFLQWTTLSSPTDGVPAT